MVNDQLVYDRLVDVARKGKTIPYCDIAGLLGLDVTIPEDRTEIMRVLDNISYKENAEGRPLLSAVAVLPEIGYPGKGFFLLARELEANDFSDERSFYYFELKEGARILEEPLAQLLLACPSKGPQPRNTTGCPVNHRQSG